MLKYCLIYLGLLTTFSAFPKDEDKGYLGIPWGEEYKIVMKKAPARKGNFHQDCPRLLQQFPLNLKFRKYIDGKNIFPGLRLTTEKEIPSRSNEKIQARYKVVKGHMDCHIFFDEKFVGHFIANEEAGSYESEVYDLSIYWGPNRETHSECEEKCEDKYRVYFHKVGDTHVLAAVTPFKKSLRFIYSDSISKEIEKAVSEVSKGKL